MSTKPYIRNMETPERTAEHRENSNRVLEVRAARPAAHRPATHANRASICPLLIALARVLAPTAR
jgi:hypothetical protein